MDLGHVEGRTEQPARAGAEPAARDAAAPWRRLEEASVLRCPACSGPLRVAARSFDCRSCSAAFPVADGVPLLMPPDEVVLVADRVMEAFHLPPSYRRRVDAALAALATYRTRSHPEFANFFARFDPPEGHAQPVPLGPAETADAVARVECLTSCFPDTLRSDVAEFRSIRLRNRSERVLFTDERNPLYLSYRLFTPEGDAIPFEAARSPLPCPLRPGGELTVPVRIALPPGLAGPLVVRLHFLLADADDVATDRGGAPAGARDDAGRSGPGARLAGVWARLRGAEAAADPPPPPDRVRWFDESPVAELRVTATGGAEEFPAVRRGSRSDFDVHEDVALADAFLLRVIRDLRARGVSRPRILEVGAGVHPIALRVCGDDATVVVSDISLVMQRLAAIMHTNHPAVLDGRAAFASLDLMHPPFRDGSFDVICICAALHHIPAPVEFLRTAARLLSPGGRFVALREPCAVDPSAPAYLAELANGFDEQMFELPEWKAMLAHAGLTVEDAAIAFGCSLKFSARA